MISGPSDFGAGPVFLSSSGGGDTVGIFTVGVVLLPVDYVSGSALSDTSTWDSSTIAGLALTQGTYVYTWGSEATADSFTVNIGDSPTPEPGTTYLLGVAGVSLVIHRLRKQICAPRPDKNLSKKRTE